MQRRLVSATRTQDHPSSYSLIDTWSCAGAAVMDGVPPHPPVHDAMSGDLTPVHGQPVLEVSAQRPVRAVAKDWVTAHVDVTNPLDSPMEAEGTVLTARGKGLAVRRVPDIGTATVRKVRAVRPPVPGRYRFTKGRGSFRIRHGKVTGFSARVMLTCGGPAAPTYEVREVRFPATRIPRSGRVDAVFRKAGSRLTLRMMVKGSRVTRGDIHYSRGAPICYGGEKFRATRR